MPKHLKTRIIAEFREKYAAVGGGRFEMGPCIYVGQCTIFGFQMIIIWYIFIIISFYLTLLVYLFEYFFPTNTR